MTENDKKQEKPIDFDDILSDLDQLDKAIIKMKIENPSVSNVKIAKQLGKNNNTIGVRLGKQKLKTALVELQKPALDILLGAQTEAALYLKSVINNPEEHSKEKIKACREILKGVLSDNIIVNVNSFADWARKASEE